MVQALGAAQAWLPACCLEDHMCYGGPKLLRGNITNSAEPARCHVRR